MLDMAKSIRQQAEQMKGTLPQSDIDDMLANAAEIEAGAKAGAFSAPKADGPVPISTRIAREHQGRLEWLMAEEACVGFQWENWRTFEITVGPVLTERNRRCKAAFSEFEAYFKLTRAGQGGAEADRHLEAYERLAHEVVDYFTAQTGSAPRS